MEITSEQDLNEAIENLKRHITEMVNEKALIELFQTELESLRHSFRANRSFFNKEAIVFLSSLRHFKARLKHFTEIQEDIEDVTDRNHYDEVMEELESLRDDFEMWAVGKRIKREIRRMQQTRLPVLRKTEETRQRSRLSIAIATLQSRALKCPKGHPTRLIYQNVKKPFWGCTWFPKCQSRRELSLKEIAILKDT